MISIDVSEQDETTHTSRAETPHPGTQQAANPRSLSIVIPGGAGDLGRILARHFHEAGHRVVVLRRRADRTARGATPWTTGTWCGGAGGECCDELVRAVDGADVVINLAGRTVNCRYTPAHRREITESRTESTSAVGEAIARAARPPRVWLQASSATLYSHRYDTPNDEATGLIGANSAAPAVARLADGSYDTSPDEWRFSIDVVQAWERAATQSPGAGRTRLVLMRLAIVMTPGGGAFPLLRRLASLGLGGTIGDGRQFVSWIHIADFVRATEEIIANECLAGPVNVVSPNPLPNRDFMRHLRAACGVPFGLGLPSPVPILAIGTRLLQTESELVLKSRRVVPGRLTDAGFSFKFPTWPEAARDLCSE